jgi:deferrochelatase/peroxidase EfeB
MAEQRGLSRRHLIAGAGVLGAAGVAGALAVEAAADGGGPDRRRVDFHGTHQAGIATPVQGHLHFASYDVTTTDRAALVALLQDWTAAAREMTADRRVGGGGSASRLAPPSDTGEAVGLDAANLTLTIGFGPGLFDDRFGLAGDRPAALVDLPSFPGDTLDATLCGGDLAVQACSDDPQVAVHAVRNLTRLAAGRAAVRWAQLGFGKASATETAGPTPRNLFGFKDGTANILGDDTDALAEHVWAHPSDGSGWMAGGSYLVARRIRMTIETWDRTSLDEQETLIGRTKEVGAPLGRARERATVRPAELPATSHVRLAHPSLHGGARLLRRGFNFVDRSDGLGHLDAGLFFLAYQRDPRRGFVPIQTELARNDALNEYLRHTGSSVWAVPPGVGPDGWWGETLLG